MMTGLPGMDENVNTSPRTDAARARQHSTISKFPGTFASPIKRATHLFDVSNKSISKSESPHGAAGAPDQHLRTISNRPGPLVPLGTNARLSLHHVSELATVTSNSTSSPLARAASDLAGLRLHWDEVPVHKGSKPESQSSLQYATLHEQYRAGKSASQDHLASMTAQDLSIPDLRDCEIVSPFEPPQEDALTATDGTTTALQSPLDSHFLISPFTMSEPNFTKLTATDAREEENTASASSLHGATLLATPGIAGITNKLATPTSPPRQAFFQGSSTGSFSRFPTPDKLALGLTPSPSHQQGQVSDSLLLPPISPSGPILVENSPLLRSSSSQTLQSESSSSGSLATSSSSSAMSDVVNDLPSSSAVQPLKHACQASSTKSSRKGGLSRSDIRESLLSFPSPPTSPRPFTFGTAGGVLQPACRRVGSASASTSGPNTSVGPVLTREATAETLGTDQLQASIDELLSEAGIDTMRISTAHSASAPAPTASVQSVRSASPLQSGSTTRPRAYSHLPPNMALPPLPPPSRLSLGQGGTPIDETPKVETPPAVKYQPPVLPLRALQESQNEKIPPGAQSLSTDNIRSGPTLPNVAGRTLRTAKSTESFLTAKSKQTAAVTKPPLPSPPSATQAETPRSIRKRRTSLSIKIPKMFSKGKKQEEDIPVLSAISQDNLQLPQSRFSPDSDVPTPISERLPTNLFKRLSRAASSPNLKASAGESLPRQTPRKEHHFVTPTSAPPVPTSFPVPALGQGEDSFDTPQPTPSLITDANSSTAGESPNADAMFGRRFPFAEMQKHNPYFPTFPPRQSSLILAPLRSLDDARSPVSPQDMDWLHQAPSLPSPASSSTGVRTKPSQPGAVDASESYHSDSGSASMSGTAPQKEQDSPSRGNGASQPCRPTTSGSSNDDEDEEEENYGGQSASSDDYYSSSELDDDEEEGSDEDDVPLAQAHPDALKAQSSLRAKVRDQYAKKKKKRIEDGPVSKRQTSQPALKQAAPEGPNLHLGRAIKPASHRDASKSTSQANAETTPSTTAPILKRNPFGFAPDELSDKLKKLDASHGRLHSLRKPPKRPDSAGERPHDLLLPQTDEHIKHRNSTEGKTNLAPPLAPFVQDSVLTMSEGSDNEETAPLRIRKKVSTSQSNAHPASSSRVQVPLRQPVSVRSSSPISPRSPSMAQHEQSFSAFQSDGIPRSALPHAQHSHHHARPAFRSKQRVYINDPQHHCSVDVDENMTAAMLLAHLRAKNAISTNPAWAVTEVWRVMGVERPLREYELLQESIESWASEPNSSLLLVKKSPLAPLLSSLSKIRSDNDEPSGGWVQLEVKRGKWSKRYLEIRGDAMYIGKSEKPRDHTLLCHFSSFDAYIVPQACINKMKTPKPFAFAVKSVDKVSLFENADQDYIHFFCVKTEVERDAWTQAIMERRSKIIKQLLQARANMHAVDTRTNLVGNQVGPTTVQALHRMPSQHSNTTANSSSSVSRSASSKSHTPPKPSVAKFAEPAGLARRPSNTHPQPLLESRQIISAGNMPPLPGAVPGGSFASIPQGREWERLGHEDRLAAIHEASKEARNGGKALLDFGSQPERTGLLGRSRAKSIGQRR